MSAELEPDYEELFVEPEVYTDADVLRLGRCRSEGTLTPLFFSDNEINVARAKAICARCVVQAACLEGALERSEPWGIWGGELVTNGKVVQYRRKGRRPKIPTDIEVDEKMV